MGGAGGFWSVLVSTSHVLRRHARGLEMGRPREAARRNHITPAPPVAPLHMVLNAVNFTARGILHQRRCNDSSRAVSASEGGVGRQVESASCCIDSFQWERREPEGMCKSIICVRAGSHHREAVYEINRAFPTSTVRTLYRANHHSPMLKNVGQNAA